MERLSAQEQQRALEAATWWCLHRLKELPLNDERLAKLGFDSVDAMRVQLKNWKLPEWLVGELPTAEKTSRKRQARAGEGDVIELPAAANAASLFKVALEELGKATEYLGERGREEYLKDERFVAYINSDDDFQPTLPGLDQRIFLGAEQHPPEPLTRLIATYTLADEPPEPLLETLHHNPSEIRQERLEQAVEELKHKAKQLAKLVRGGGIRRGPPTEGENSETHLIGWFVHHQRELGQSDDEIREWLAQHGYHVPPEEIRRLGGLHLH